MEEKLVGPIEAKNEALALSSSGQTMGDFTRVVCEQQSIRQEVMDALAKFEHRPITKSELGPLVGMNDEEMAMLDVFWEPAFNKGWLYLSDEMVKTQMTNDRSGDALGNFYRRLLKDEDYTSNIDYKQIEYEDPLIDLYWKSRSNSIKTETKPKKVNGKRYYAITGETYKDLLIKASTPGGKTARLLFRKVEAAARLMYDYINALNAIMAQKRIAEHKVEVDAAKNQIKEKDVKINRLHNINASLVCCKKLEGLSGSIYIIANETYASQGIYKIGRTKSMTLRMSTHNSDKIIGDKYVVLAEFHVQNEVLVEHIIHAKLIHLRVKGETEIFMAPFQELRDIVQLIVNNDAAATTCANAAVDARYNLEKEEFKSSDWMRGIPAETFGPQYFQSANAISGKIMVSEMDEAGKLNVAQFAVTTFIKIKRDIDFTLPADANKIISPVIEIKWTDLFAIVKNMLQRGECGKLNEQSAEWSALFGKVVAEAISIKYTPRRALRSK